MVEKIIEKKILLIGGAPRSGTTLLCNLFDSHPQFLVFPFEHSTIEQYYWNKGNQLFFESEFIDKRKYGQQSILASEDEINQYTKKMRSQYGNDFLTNVNPRAFKEGYQRYLRVKGHSLENVLRALALGLVSSNEYAKLKMDKVKYIVFKQPMYTELFARYVNQDIGSVKFVQITRDPIARYASAKKRRLVLHDIKGKKLSYLNKVNFTYGHTQIDMAADYLANRNLIDVGNKSYFVARYEDLLGDISSFFRNMSLFLDVEYRAEYFRNPTRLGEQTEAGTAFTNKKGVDFSAKDRIKQYNSLTTEAERKVHKYLLYRFGLSDIHIGDCSFIINSLKKPKYSNLKNYFLQLILIPFQIFYNKEKEAKKFIEKARNKKVAFSGAT